MLFFFPLFFALFQTQPPPFPRLPVSNLTLPDCTGKLALVTGGKNESIALQVGLRLASLGVQVTLTTRNKHTYNFGLLTGTTIKVVQLVLGSYNNGLDSPRRVASQFITDNGRRPDFLVHGAGQVVNGLYHDMSDEFHAWAHKMSVIDPIAIEQEFLRSDATAVKMTVLDISSFAGWGTPPFYQQQYNSKSWEHRQKVEAMATSLRFSNTEWLMTMCVFVNTSSMDFSVNPSAEPGDLTVTGDFAAQEFQRLFKLYARTRGFPPALTAEGIVQALVARELLNLTQHVVFDVSQGLGSAGLYQLYGQSSAVTVPSFRVVSSSPFIGINITNHVPPVK